MSSTMPLERILVKRQPLTLQQSANFAKKSRVLGREERAKCTALYQSVLKRWSHIRFLGKVAAVGSSGKPSQKKPEVVKKKGGLLKA